MREESAKPDAIVARYAARQHGVVSGEQLRRAGIGRSGLLRRVEAGRLHRVHRGVFAVGHDRVSFEGRCLAAVLACGKGALVSHRSAAALWTMLPPSPGSIEITVPGTGGRRKRSGIALRRSTTLGANDEARRAGIPLTVPARTLGDLRRVLSAGQLQKATRRALDLRLDVASALEPEPDVTRSELERLFLRLCRAHSIPGPEVNGRVEPFEVDFIWRDLRLIVETDGFAYHANRSSFESDRARDAHLQALGFRVLRFTYRQVTNEPQRVAAIVRRVIDASDGRAPGSRL